MPSRKDLRRTPALDLVLARYANQRRRVIATFLWVLLVVGVLSNVTPVLMPGDVGFTNAMAYQLATLLALVVLGLTLNRRTDTQVAVWLVTAVYLTIALTSQFQPTGSTMSTYQLFIPLTLAGLLLQRRGLYLTALLSLSVVWSGAIADVTWAGMEVTSPVTRWILAADFTVVYLAVAVLLDRFAIVLRASLQSAAEHESRLLDETLEAKEELEAQRELNEKIREHFPGLYFVIDEQGTFVQWNKNVADLLGLDESDMPGTNAFGLAAPEDREAVANRIAKAMAGESTPMYAKAIDSNGRRIPVYLSGSTVNFRGRRLLAGVGVDRREIDAARQRIADLNEVLKDRVESLGALHAIDAAIANSRDTNSTLGLILERVLGHLHMDAGNVLLYSETKERLVLGARRGFRESEWRPVSVPIGHEMVGRCAERRETVRLYDSDDIARHVWRHEQYRREGFESYVAVPLVANGDLMGVMELFARRRVTADGEFDEFLAAVGAQAAIAIDSANLIAGLELSNESLRQSYDLTIEGWAKALELRDQETEGHSRRVTELTLELAKRMGVEEDKLMDMRRGALLHDIGKMGVPDSILLKPGKLDESEWEVMKRHTTYSYELLKAIPFLWSSLEIPYLHHERWDGTGYPLGLKGDEIPLEARIFAIVDVYDALTSDRPYRLAWSRDETLEYIAGQAGSHFDPAVTADFLRMMGADRVGRPAREFVPAVAPFTTPPALRPAGASAAASD